MEFDTTFDYVIVGGGSAGCVLASRLTENPDISVCLLEYGGDGKDLAVRVPAGLLQRLRCGRQGPARHLPAHVGHHRGRSARR